jgi:branched-chain amino acid transport system permease protein
VVVTIVLMAAFSFVVAKTRLGRDMRACEQDLKMASLLGVDIDRTISLTFVIGAALAALGGVLVAPSQAVNASMDSDVLVLAFAISVIGGLGSIVGSVVGALVVGEVISFGLNNPVTNPFALAFVFIVMAAVLTVRPWGLFGRPEQ